MANRDSPVPTLFVGSDPHPALLRHPSCFSGAVSLATHFLAILHVSFQRLLFTRPPGHPRQPLLSRFLLSDLLQVCYINTTSVDPQACCPCSKSVYLSSAAGLAGNTPASCSALALLLVPTPPDWIKLATALSFSSSLYS